METANAVICTEKRSYQRLLHTDRRLSPQQCGKRYGGISIGSDHLCFLSYSADTCQLPVNSIYQRELQAILKSDQVAVSLESTFFLSTQTSIIFTPFFRFNLSSL